MQRVPYRFLFFLIIVSLSFVHFLVSVASYFLPRLTRLRYVSDLQMWIKRRAAWKRTCKQGSLGLQLTYFWVWDFPCSDGYSLQVSTRFQDVSGWGSRFKSFRVVSWFPEAMRSSPLWNAILLHWKLWHSSSARVKRLVWWNPSFDWKKIRALREPCELNKKVVDSMEDKRVQWWRGLV